MTKNCLVFIGCLNRETPYFQGARGHGLAIYSLDEDTLEATKLAETDAIDNPTFLSVNADGSRIYATAEVFEWKEGLVTAFAFDRATNALSYINKQPTLGILAAHNTISGDGSKVLVSNYAMGDGGPDQSVAVFGIRAGWWTDPGAGKRRPQGNRAQPRAPGAEPRPQRQCRTRHRHHRRRRSRHRPPRLLPSRQGWDAGEAERIRHRARRRPAPCRLPSGWPLHVRHERARFDLHDVVHRAGHRRTRAGRHPAGSPRRGPRQEPLRRYPDLAGRPFPLWLQPRSRQCCGRCYRPGHRQAVARSSLFPAAGPRPATSP